MRRATAVLGVLLGCGSGGGGGPAEEYRPRADVERPAYVTLVGSDIGLPGDFDVSGDTIFLLDRTGRVVVVERRAGALKLAGHIGRSGAGPGELLRPTGLAVVGGAVAVIDGTRLHFLSRTGERPRSVPVSLPCVMLLPSVAASRTGVFVAGGCFRGGHASDTMKAVLAWSADTAVWEVVAEAPRYTRDGTFGSVFGARSLLTTGEGGEHAFGGGETNCLWSVVDTAGRPSATERCPIAASLYVADPPPELRARIRRTRIPGMTVRWPGHLPAYMDRFVTERGVVLLRPFTTDSLVLQLAGADPVDIAVAPVDGLLGCKAQGCVWLRDEAGAPSMIVLDRAWIERRVSLALKR